MTDLVNHLLVLRQFGHMQVYPFLPTLSCEPYRIVVETTALIVPDLPAIVPLGLLPIAFVRRSKNPPGLPLLTSDHYAREGNLHCEQVTRKAMIAPRP